MSDDMIVFTLGMAVGGLISVFLIAEAKAEKFRIPPNEKLSEVSLDLGLLEIRVASLEKKMAVLECEEPKSE
jgi:hypothetical protein